VSVVENEQVKLTATYLNGLAIAIFAVGGLAPVVGIVSGTAQAGAAGGIAVLTTICVSVSAGLHLAGRRMLRGLKP
jgi:hypothetical protein